MKIKVGDTVKITAGKNKGQTGKVERVLPTSSGVIVAGLNLSKKHVKAKSNTPGQIIQIAKPLPTGNIALLCPKCGQPTRVGYSLAQDGKKVRLCRKCKAVLS